MANRKWHPCIVLAEKVLFRFAFAVCIAFAVVLWFLAMAAASIPFRSDSHLLVGVFITLLFLGLFAIGAGSYVVFQSLTRADYVLTESERWLAELRNASNPWIKRRKVITRCALWIPTLTVILVCTFFDYTWSFTTHLLHPGRGRLIGYEVSIPLTWSIAYTEIRKQDDRNFDIVVERYRGLIKAGSGLYWGRKRPFTTSNINFRTFPGGDRLSSESATKIISFRTLPFAKGTIMCREDVPPQSATGHYIQCSTPTGDFSAYFDGTDEDVTDFYRILSSVKALN